MNEPAIFYTPEGIERIKKNMKEFIEKEPSKNDVWFMRDSLRHLANNPYDYKSFYHTVDGKKIRHDKVHNLYGYNMTRAAAEGLQEIDNNRRYLLFSRSSYIGMHRYGGIWTGDNMSWWSHLLLNIKMMPSLNMCGFLYTGADIGGFGANTTRELLLRWLAFGIFTPLMRNHSAEGTRKQECYQFEKIETFKHLIEIRYRLIPYIYSEYMKAALQYDMYFKPLSFVYQSDEIAKEIEDQLLIGNEIMIAPVYTQNAKGRCVYLPEEMMMIKFVSDGTINTKQYEKGYHYIDTKLDEVVLFVRKGCCIPIAEPAEYVEQIDTKNMKLYGYDNSEYLLYDDDGITKEYQNENYKTMKY
jgi:alpha-glucosidase